MAIDEASPLLPNSATDDRPPRTYASNENDRIDQNGGAEGLLDVPTHRVNMTAVVSYDYVSAILRICEINCCDAICWSLGDHTSFAFSFRMFSDRKSVV